MERWRGEERWKDGEVKEMKEKERRKAGSTADYNFSLNGFIRMARILPSVGGPRVLASSSAKSFADFERFEQPMGLSPNTQTRARPLLCHSPMIPLPASPQEPSWSRATA